MMAIATRSSVSVKAERQDVSTLTERPCDSVGSATETREGWNARYSQARKHLRTPLRLTLLRCPVGRRAGSRTSSRRPSSCSAGCRRRVGRGRRSSRSWEGGRRRRDARAVEPETGLGNAARRDRNVKNGLEVRARGSRSNGATRGGNFNAGRSRIGYKDQLVLSLRRSLQRALTLKNSQRGVHLKRAVKFSRRCVAGDDERGR